MAGTAEVFENQSTSFESSPSMEANNDRMISMGLTKYLERPDGRLAYSDSGGNGELVVMLPDVGALRSEYRYLAPALQAAGYRTVTVDLRGHGESSVPWPVYDIPAVGGDILALTKELNCGPAHLIATSFSPAAAVWAAVEHPESVRSLVLIGPSVRKIHGDPLLKTALNLVLNNPWRVESWILYYRLLYPTRKPVDFEDYLHQLRRNLAEPGRFDAAKALAKASRWPAEERLKKVKPPSLVVMGTKDLNFIDPECEAEFIAGKMGTNFELVKGAGHFPQTEMPEETARIMKDFLNGVALRRASGTFQ